MENNCAARTAVIIPAYKPDDRLPPYVEALEKAGVGKIVIVDDGSGDAFTPLFAQLPEDGVCHVSLGIMVCTCAP